MANTETKETKEPKDLTEEQKKQEAIEAEVKAAFASLKKYGIQVALVNTETEKMIDLAFGSQTDVDNKTRFVHAFLFDAVKSRLLYMASANVASYEREIAKQCKLHPTRSREQVIVTMLASRKARELKELADNSELIKSELNK